MKAFGTPEGFENPVLISHAKVMTGVLLLDSWPLTSLNSPDMDPFPCEGGQVAMYSLPGPLLPPRQGTGSML